MNKGIFLLCSDEPLLKNEKSTQIMSQINLEYSDIPLLIFTSSDFQSTGKPNLKALENELIDPGLFGGDRLIKIYLYELNNTSLQVLYLIATRLRDGVFVIIDLPRIKSNLAKTKAQDLNNQKLKTFPSSEKIFSYLKFVGASIDLMYPPQGQELKHWIYNRSLKYKLNISPEALDYFALSCEGNLSLIDETLNILSLSPQDHALTLDEASQVLTSDSRFLGSDLADAIISGEAQRALHVFNSLLLSKNTLDLTLLSIISALDKELNIIPKARENLGNLKNYYDKSKFFAPYSIKTLPSMEAIIKAAKDMPDSLYTFLIESLNEASLKLSCYDIESSVRAIRRMCASVGNFEVLKIKPL